SGARVAFARLLSALGKGVRPHFVFEMGSYPFSVREHDRISTVAHRFDVVTQTVVLAAGTGTRLGSAQAGVPKPLLTVAGVPLIAHALRHAADSGCTDAIVVVGFQGARVRAAVEAIGSALRVAFVETAD